MNGWAIPAATDIAFALGVLALLGPRVPLTWKVLLTSLAIVDDLGAIIVIAVFYTSNLAPIILALAGAGIVILAAMNRLGVVSIAAYILVGVAVWVLVLKSGVHATLAGVAVGMAIPLRGKGDTPSPLHLWKTPCIPGLPMGFCRYSHLPTQAYPSPIWRVARW